MTETGDGLRDSTGRPGESSAVSVRARLLWVVDALVEDSPSPSDFGDSTALRLASGLPLLLLSIDTRRGDLLPKSSVMATAAMMAMRSADSCSGSCSVAAEADATSSEIERGELAKLVGTASPESWGGDPPASGKFLQFEQRQFKAQCTEF